ncbi:MAG: type IV secretory system conjugative DNA transfer family protein [Eubacterium sp.]|nr:type IV secretory system conjugative DNA transfer family protein [Eubacterium sp.]
MKQRAKGQFKVFLREWAVSVGGGRIAAGAVFSFLLCLYLAGMTSQFFSREIITGRRQLVFSPVRVILEGALSGECVAAALMIFGAALLAVFLMLLQLFGEELKDPLGRFKMAEDRGLGLAGFCKCPQALPGLEVTAYREAEGFILGRYEGRYLSFNPQGAADNRNIIVYGAAGSGKTRGFILPNVRQIIKRWESGVILDTKGMIYKHTQALAREKNYDVYLFDLKNPGAGNGWHCLKDIGQDLTAAHQAASVIVENTLGPGEKNAAKFWVDGEKNLLVALILLVNWEAETARKGGRRKNSAADSLGEEGTLGTMGRLYALLTAEGGAAALGKAFEAIRVQAGDEAPAWRAWRAFSANAKEEVQGGFIGGLAVRLRLFQSPEICEAFGKDEIRLKQLGRRRTLIYVNLDDSDASRSFLAAFFLTRLFSVLYADADARPEQRCPVAVNVVCDEFSNLGKIPDFDKKIATCRSRGIGVCIVVQTLGALMEMYPGRAWEQIVGNCAVELLMKAGDKTTAEHFEWMAGQTAVVDEETSVFKRGLFEGTDLTEGYRESRAERERPLLRSDEIRRLPSDKVLAVVDNAEVILAEKIDIAELPEAGACGRGAAKRAPSFELPRGYFENLYKGDEEKNAGNVKAMERGRR